LLRKYSRIGGDNSQPAHETDDEQTAAGTKGLAYLTGSIYEVAAQGRPEETRIVIGLAEKLGLAVSSSVAEVTNGYQKYREQFRSMRSSGFRRGRGFGSRRKMQSKVIETWPELEHPSAWPQSDLLSTKNQKEFFEKLLELPDYVEFKLSLEERNKTKQTALDLELTEVKYRRLLHQLESIVLAQNLPLVADPGIVSRYREMVKAEAGFLSN
jgi:hypothetical protein